MANVTLAGVEKSFGATRILQGIELDIRDGELLVLVGPSGCGKSTLLRCIAGLEDVTGGEVRIGGRDVTRLAPRERDVAMVFQSYALYPHMTVRENLAFGLKLRGAPPQDIDARVRDAAAMLELEALLERRPAQLSGGQRQRVAMGRAVVRSPKVFLFDEPLSNLDAALRVQMRAELLKLHRRLGTTTVYVTHDQVEAMTLAHRIAVLRGGELQQVGPAMELYARPANKFVAGFIGSPPMNFFAGEVQDGELAGAGFRVPLPAPIAAGTRAVLGVRPNDVAFSRLAISIPGRVVRKSVERSRWKRLIREAFRLNKEKIVAGMDIVAVPSRVPGDLTRQDVEAALLALLARRR